VFKIGKAPFIITTPPLLERTSVTVIFDAIWERGIWGMRSGVGKVKKGLWLAASLLVAVALLVGACQSGVATFNGKRPFEAQKR
jgi:hypothetical protein